MKKLPRERGQAILLVLLSMAVVLTIVLSIVSRSVTDITVSTKGDESLRAFSAAEAGVERALIDGSSFSNLPIGNAFVSVNVSGGTTTSQEVANPVAISSGESLTFWFVGHDSNGALTCSGTACFVGDRLKLCWGNPGTSSSSSITPAVEVSVVYAATPGNYSTLQIARAAIDPNSSRVSSSNNFSSYSGSATGITIAGTSYAFCQDINFGTGGSINLNIPSVSYTTQNGLQYMKVRMFYNTSVSHGVGITTNGIVGGGSFPPQGATIQSVGTAGDATRKVQVFQGYGDTPEIFDAALYSPGGLTK